MNKWIKPLMALAFLAVPNIAFADVMDVKETRPCRLEIEVNSAVDWLGPSGRGYEVFGQSDSFESVMLEVRHTGQPCRYVLTGSAAFGTGTAELLNGSSRLEFDLLASTNGPSLVSPDYFGSNNSRIEGQFGPGPAVKVIPILVAVPSGQFVRSGSYQGGALLRLFSEEAGDLVFQAETLLTVNTRVAAALEVSSPDFGGGLREASIDLGMLDRTIERVVNFAVRSNADVMVRFDSRNGGKLAHEYGAPGIPYELKIGGMALNPGSGDSTTFPYRFDAREVDIPILIHVPGPTMTRAAGTYDDTLTVTFTVP